MTEEQEYTNEMNAADNVGYWLSQVRDNIDLVFGAGYADKNPQLVAEMVKVCAFDSAISWFHQVITSAVNHYIGADIDYENFNSSEMDESE